MKFRFSTEWTNSSCSIEKWRLGWVQHFLEAPRATHFPYPLISATVGNSLSTLGGIQQWSRTSRISVKNWKFRTNEETRIQLIILIVIKAAAVDSSRPNWFREEMLGVRHTSYPAFVRHMHQLKWLPVINDSILRRRMFRSRFELLIIIHLLMRRQWNNRLVFVRSKPFSRVTFGWSIFCFSN